MEFRVLGPVALVADGRIAPVRSSLQRTLLALLLEDANRVVGVDRIVDALWGHEDWDAGQQRLWFHVSKLRRRLAGADATVERSGTGYRLLIDPSAIDAHRFEQLVDRARDLLDADADASAPAREALALWRGAPYEDVPDDAVGRAERVRLEELHLTAVELWVEARLRAGRADAVVPELEKLSIDHPYREGFRNQLMRALWTGHRPSEALAVFASTRALLHDELGIEPSAALRHLATRIAEGGEPPPRRPSTFHPAVPPPRYGAGAFVGREAQLTRLTAAVIQEATSARFVRGQAGAGKSSLLRALIARVERDSSDLIAIYAACQAGTGPLDAFGPFRDIARRLDGDGSAAPAQTVTPVGEVRLRALTGLPPVAAAALEAMHGPGEPRTAGAVADLLRQMIDAVAAVVPILLVVDDLHWADSSSIDLLRRLVTLVERRLTVVMAYRQHELADRQVRELEHDVQARTAAPVVVDLDRTTVEERRTFVDALLDREPNAFGDDFRRLIARRSEGHALFAVELIDELRRRGAIRRRDGGRWEHTRASALDGAWPARVHAVLESRFARVERRVLRILRAASVEGEMFTTAVVAEVVGAPESRVVDDLSHRAAAVHEVVEAVGAARIGHTTVYRYRFRHNLFQGFVYGSLDPVERAMLHARVAASLARLTAGHGDDWALTLARHHEAAGNVEEAVRHLGRAAQRAVRLAANDQAVTHVEHALRLLRTLPAGGRRDALEADLHMQLGVARSIIDGFSAAAVETTFERSAELLQDAASARRFPALFGLWVAAASRADVARSASLVAVLSAAADDADDDGLRLMALHAHWTDRLFYGDLDGCVAAVEAGRRLYRHDVHHPLCYRYGNHDAAVCALSLGAIAAALRGETARARRFLTDGQALAEVLDHRPSRVQSLALASWVPQLAGDPAGTSAAAEAALVHETAGAVPLWFGLARFMRGWARAVHGRDETAIAALETELRTQREMRTSSWMPVYATLLGDAYLAAGRADDAERTAATGEDAGRPFYRSEIARVRAEAAALAGRTEEAVVGLGWAVDDALTSGAIALALRSALALARIAPDVGRRRTGEVVARLPAGHRSHQHAAAEHLLRD